MQQGGEKSETGLAVFKKRSRPGASRKRKRVSQDEDLSAGRHFPEPGKKENRANKKTWEREQYAANGKGIEGIEIATAHKVDVGGELNSATKHKKPFGPMRAPTHIRTSVRVDYQADICKDYKETGYCGFGDSCKFLHDRSDYKSGWQLDRDWAEREKVRREKLLRGENPDEEVVGKEHDSGDIDDDGLPFACYICRKEFTRPVATLCGHYFCEKCALARMETNSTCAICKKQLSGTLNAAPKLSAKLKLRQGQIRNGP